MAHRKHAESTAEFPDFYLPFGGKLSGENRWVKLAELMPWRLIEECYMESLTQNKMGAPALSGRVAYGAQIIKERLGISDEETVEQISENPYLQFFLGYKEYLKEPAFEASMMVHFRNRFTSEHHVRINEELIPTPESDDDDPPTHSGKLLIDATCTPADIKYPTDLNLLNEAREKTESIIDKLHAEVQSRNPSPQKSPQKVRTYRQKARQRYLKVAKAKRMPFQKRRKAIRAQLNYVKRNLGHITAMVEQHEGLLCELDSRTYKNLLVINTLYLQQQQMYDAKEKSVENRIVSIGQPHVRPIMRGKVGKAVEFGAKISISHRPGGYVSLDRLSWEAYNESKDLIGQVENYYARYGYYPESLHADQIYLNRENRSFCKEKGIRLSGKPLGRPPKVTAQNQEALAEIKALQRQDEIDRIPVEGKFGIAKRKGTLGRIMGKLARTSESIIHVGIVVLNLDQRLRELLCALIYRLKTRFPSLQIQLIS